MASAKKEKKSSTENLAQSFIDSAEELKKSLGMEGEGSSVKKVMKEAKPQESEHKKDMHMVPKIAIKKDKGLEESVSEAESEQDEDESEEENEMAHDKTSKDAAADNEENDDEDYSEDEEEQREEDSANDEKKAKALKKPLKKSKTLLEELEADPETQEPLNVEPFLKKLAKGMSDRLASMQEMIEGMSAGSDMHSILKPMAKSIISLGEQQAVLFDSIEAIGSQPVKSTSLLKSAHDRFYGPDESEEGKSANALAGMSRDKILAKAAVAFEYNAQMMGKIENRLNEHKTLKPEWIEAILAAKEEK